jgi:serine/threonine protein kinase
MQQKQPLLPKDTRELGKIYWGDRGTVNAMITALNRQIQTGLKPIGTGSFGYAYVVGSGENARLIKKSKNGLKILQQHFVDEVDAANTLQALIPDYVTQLKGARYSVNDNQYIIFDLLKGTTLSKYLQILESEYVRDNSRVEHNLLLERTHRNLSYLFSALQMSNRAMNNIGWSHCDIKPDNLFFNVQQDVNGRYIWSTAVCWLIDFGGAKMFNQRLNTRTPTYSASNILRTQCAIPIRDIQGLLNVLHISPSEEAQHLTGKFNAFSREIIWIKDMQKIFRNDSRYKYPLSDAELGVSEESRKQLLDAIRGVDSGPISDPLEAQVHTEEHKSDPLVDPRLKTLNDIDTAIKEILIKISSGKTTKDELTKGVKILEELNNAKRLLEQELQLGSGRKRKTRSRK